MEFFGPNILAALEERIWLLATTDISSMGPVELVERGLCDPVRVFVKGEPHSNIKIQQQRMRLIFSVSLVDQLVERFFAHVQNKSEIAVWAHLPSMVGIGLDDEHAEFMMNSPSWFPGQTSLVESDVSGWDWTVQADELRTEAHMRCSLIKHCPHTLKNLIHSRFHCLINKILVFSDGDYVVSPDGIMPSGCYVTSSSNSRIRAMVSLRAREMSGYDYTRTCIKCVGDDSVESNDMPLSQLRANIELQGHSVKDARVATTANFELCSHRFINRRPHFLNMAKTLVAWACKGRSLDASTAVLGLSERLKPDERAAVKTIITRYGMPSDEPQQKQPDGQDGHGHGATP
jgi:hypothetical protein